MSNPIFPKCYVWSQKILRKIKNFKKINFSCWVSIKTQKKMRLKKYKQ